MSAVYYRGQAVYLSDGARLGHIREIGHAADYLHVQEGRFVIRDWYVPVSAVQRVTRDGVYLSAGRAALERNRWYVPPEAYLLRQGATPGYQYTSPSSVPPFGEGDAAR